MRLGSVHVGPRRVAAFVAGAAGMGGIATVTLQAGVEWGVVLLAGIASAALFAVGLTRAELRRHRQAIGERERLRAEQWQQAQAAHGAQLRELRAAAAAERASVTARLDAVARAQQRAAAAAAWQVARRAAGPDPARRDDEVALVRVSELFDAAWYQAQLGTRLADTAAHYVDSGAALGLDPHPLFASARYLERHPEALARWRTPLAHFQSAGGDLAPSTVRYDVHGYPDEADLMWEYLSRGLHREPDTFVLYRIIGNDLPPRHRAGQGLDNLRFVLDHEPDLPGCQKRWVVNRIVDPRTEKQVIALLEEHGQEVLHIPFQPAEYRRVGWRFAGLEPPGLTYRHEFDLLSPGQQQRALDHVYHFKNLYVMNNNGARNAALQQGRRLAKWVLPWDGNCFLTRKAWDELVAAVAARPYLKYFTVPMARVVDNQILLRPDPAVDASEEPQLLFRRDAAEEFHPDARYGRRPKVELFFRLGIPGPWDDWGRVPWDDPMSPPSPEARQVGQASWVARLFSGQESQEADSIDRQWRRIEAIRECIDQVDQELAGAAYDPAALFTWDEAALARQRDRYASGEPGPARVVTELVAQAERSLRRPSPREAVEQASVLALAGFLTGRTQHYRHGADLLRRWLRRHRGTFDIDLLREVGCLLDAARLLERDGALEAAAAAQLRDWAGRYRRWLDESEPGVAARNSLDHRGTWYDVQVAALDAYLGDLGGMLAALRRAFERAGQQLPPDYSHTTVYNLFGWARLATYARRVGQDLWSHEGLAAAVPRVHADPDRRAVLAHLAAPYLPSLPVSDLTEGDRRDPWAVRQIFDHAAGVRPFWVLGEEADAA